MKEEYQGSLKSGDTEEWFDLIFYRPIGYVWAVIARRLGVTPNAITIASIFIGVGAGVAFYYDNFWINLLGMFLLILADSFDSADGQLARMTGQYSRLGRFLDGMASDVWFVAIYMGICLRENYTDPFFMDHRWVIWVMAAIAGFCHAQQAAMADSYRQFHLFFIKGESQSEVDDAKTLWSQFHALTWKKDFFSKLQSMLYAGYTSLQECATPQRQRLREMLQKKYGSNIPKEFAEEARAESLPLMKYTNLLTFNFRSWVLFISILAFRMPWLYFAFEITVMNILLIYTIRRHECMCVRLQHKLQTL